MAIEMGFEPMPTTTRNHLFGVDFGGYALWRFECGTHEEASKLSHFE